MNEYENNTRFEFILYDVAETRNLEVYINKSIAGLGEDTWEIWVVNPTTGRKEPYTLKKVNELDTYDKAASMALNLIDDAVRRIYCNGKGCRFDGTVEARFNLKTGY